MDDTTNDAAENDADAREAAHQILGDSVDHVLTGDWRQALTDTAALWAPAA
ncbi:hypothetical protein [Streptomyces sp. ML-6]|uniref:hypothetical protein n=1 Tax=Streptomyces sp. ML-6 TaxID=2982693 RepID=UPI0024C03A95|nr:hypothetical protein [Streptomyces sp. ML-6]MDK0524987.1 hypothetical protein [Streptomyces sp. ML-6]